MKRFAAVLLAMLMLLALVAGCTQTPASTPASTPAGGTSTPASTPSGDDDEGSMDETLDIVWYIAGDNTAYKDDNEVAKTLNERFNVNMIGMKINGMDDDKMNVTLASGDIPDVFVRWGVANYYNDGIIQPVDKGLVEKYMPETYKVIDSYGDTAWLLNTSPSDGELMAIPQISVTGDAIISLAVRQDWLDAVDAEVPTTLEELTEVMRKFTFDDPDGNGADDTYGLSGPGLHGNPLGAVFPTIFGAFHAVPNMWLPDANGDVTYGGVNPRYKDALKQLKAWYDEGILDPEWVTTDNATFYSKLQTGKVGFWDTCHPSYLDPYNIQTGTVALSKANNPDADWQLMAPVKGPEGLAGGWTYGAIGGWGMMFGAKTSRDKVIRAMQIGEAMNTDVELFTMTFFGIEGVTYAKNDEGVNALLDGVVEAEYGSKAFRTGSYISTDIASVFTNPAVMDLNIKSFDYPVVRNVIDSGAVDTLGAAAGGVDNAEMTKIVQEYFFNAITGAVDIDATWDDYVAQWYSLGGQVLTDIAREQPILYEIG